MTYRFDPELAQIVPLLPAVDISDPAAMRDLPGDFLIGEPPDLSALDIEDRFIPGPTGAPDIRIRIYAPKAVQQNSAGLLHIHGGGFVLGSVELEHGPTGTIASSLGIVVVSVDYRLAPEHPYPAAIEDCFAALTWFSENAAALSVDRDRIGVFGQSAGGGLAAALALLTRDRGGPSLCFQYLGVPELDDRLDTVSMLEFSDTPLWTRPNAVLSWRHYLGARHQPGAHDVPIYAAPARASIEQLRGLPPAFVSAMEFDPLRDEDVLYALKLMQAGVPVELHTYPGTFHGSNFMPEAAISKRQNAEMLDVLRRALQPTKTA